MTKIEIVPYNPTWPTLFAAESALIKAALGNNCITVHHIGSTAIPGMSAKPIIDMIPTVKNISKVDAATALMIKLGYDAKGEAGMLFRRFFTKSTDIISCNVHIYEDNAGEIDRLIKFRDWMRTHPEDADNYADLKLKLTAQFANDRLRYTIGKENFVASIDNKTGFSGLRIVKALTDREWEAYHRIRKQQIFDLIGIEYDYNHYTYKEESHTHLTLYKGSVIAGAAQLERLNTDEAALRPFAIDAAYQNHGLGSAFLASIERWLKQQGCRILRLHANPPAVRFYERHGYSRMPFHEPGRVLHFEVVDMAKVILE
jgi:GrpB-like predicted nucleotidyltransferase (UPF0157 family)/GNAT superfamily N-acetyltransferase